MKHRVYHKPSALLIAIPKWTTLDDLERPRHILQHKLCVLRSSEHKLEKSRSWDSTFMQ